MKLLGLALFTFFLALASAALVRRDDDYALFARDGQSSSNSHIVVGTLPDGRKRLGCYDGGQYLGHIEEGPDGNATVYDASGKPVDEDDDDDDDDNASDQDPKDGEGADPKRLLARSRIRILRKLWKFIRKYGSKAWVSNI